MAAKNTEKRTILLPIPENMYELFMIDNEVSKKMLFNFYEKMPECFPEGMSEGFILNGRTRPSKKLKFQMRKIRITGKSYRIRPSFLMPYNRALTEEVSGPLFLLKFGVPFWAIAEVFGRNAMWWYRLYLSLSMFSIVGTTIRKASKLPEDILVDEQHIKVRGKKAFVATTAANDCFLGMEVCPKANEEFLHQGYQVFKKESQNISIDYEPLTVNTDGWSATQNALKFLYPKIAVIECFLHAFLKVRDRSTKKLKSYFDTAADKIWNCYKASSKRQLAQQIRRLSEWATNNIMDSPMKENVLKLCKKKKKWMAHFDIPNAHRTSNMIDRLMRNMNRHAFNSQMFHGKELKSTTKNYRAFALLFNFTPSSPKVRHKDNILTSPAARLNGFVYHHNWLHNLLVSASLNGFRHHRNPL